MKKYPLVLAALACLYSGITKADSSLFPFNPRASLWGGAGNNTYTRVDAMIPLFGNADGDIYTDLQGQWGTDKSWVGSLGLGGRQTFGDNFLLGAYGFIDRSQTSDSWNANQWWVFNPGIEAMNVDWDGRINFYLPVSTDKRTIETAYGDQLGIPDQVVFQGHNQYDGIYNVDTEIAKGADADVGYTFSNFYNVRAHGGGYYFMFPGSSDDIHGGEGGVSVPINQYTNLEFDDSYDNIQKNTAVISVKFSVGAPHSDFKIIQDRLLDPIYRHLGTLYTNSGIPSNTSIDYTGIAGILERNNIWFFEASGGSTFNPNVGVNNCTYENPCNGSSFNQANVNSINTISSNTNFYFNPGTYFIGNFNLNNGQSMYGRTLDYTMPSNAPIFVGALVPQGNNTLDSFTLLNDGTNSIGINLQNANNVSINNLIIGEPNYTQGYRAGINILNANNLTVSSSVINASSTASQTFGITGTGTNNNMIINNNTINVAGKNFNIGFGLQLGTANILIENNIFNMPASTGGGTTGIIIATSGTATIVNNTLNISSVTDASIGVLEENPGATVILNHNTFNINNVLLGYGIAITGGVIDYSNNTFNFSGSGINTCINPIGGTLNDWGGNIFNNCT